jgi:hypothetical protein
MPRQPRFRAKRTTPDPYPTHDVLVFVGPETTEEEIRRSQMVNVSDLAGRFHESAYGNELTEIVEVSPGPHFRAKLTSQDEVVLLTTALTLEEVMALPEDVLLEISHPDGGPAQAVNRSQLAEFEPLAATVA